MGIEGVTHPPFCLTQLIYVYMSQWHVGEAAWQLSEFHCITLDGGDLRSRLVVPTLLEFRGEEHQAVQEI